MKRQWFLLAMGATLLSLLCAAFMFSSPAIAAKPKTLTIGCIGALTGFAAPGEIPMVQGSQVMADWINEKGGITVKGKHYKIKLIVEDHKSTAQGAAEAAIKLVDGDKVKFVVGGVMPFTNVAINSVTTPAKVLHAAIYNVATPAEYGPKTPYTFVTMNGTLEGIHSMLDYVKQTYPKVKRIAVTVPDDGSIPYIQPKVIQMAKERGMTVAGGKVIGFALNTLDFTPVARKVLALNPDGICMINGWASMIGGILKVVRESGYTKPVWMTNYQPAADALTVAGKKASEGFLFQGLLANDPNNTPLVAQLHKLIKARFNSDNVYYSALGWDNLWMVLQAIEAAQSLNPTVVRNKWQKMDTMKSVWGTAHVGGLKTYGIRHTMTHPIPIISYVNGKPKTMKWMDVTSP